MKYLTMSQHCVQLSAALVGFIQTGLVAFLKTALKVVSELFFHNSGLVQQDQIIYLFPKVYVNMTVNYYPASALWL